MKTGRVIIIGAGPAGSALAIALRRISRSPEVALVDAKTFPRAKICGEFLSPGAIQALGELIDIKVLAGLGARQVNRLTFELDGRERSWELPRAALAISRHSFDRHMLDCAAGVQTTIIQPARVERVEYADGSVGV